MSESSLEPKRPLILQFLFGNSLFLIVGTLVALVWANLDPPTVRPDGANDPGSYQAFLHAGIPLDYRLEAFLLGPLDEEAEKGSAADQKLNRLAESTKLGQQNSAASNSPATSDAGGSDKGESAPVHEPEETHPPDAPHAGPHHRLSIHYFVQDVLMALFFAIAAKEVWEAFLPGGALSNIQKAATPLLATAGGILGPVAVYLGGALLLTQGAPLSISEIPFAIYSRGWAIPTATDIAFSLLFARMVFGGGHPAIAFLLLLAIADDGLGLIIMAVFFPQNGPFPAWFLVTGLAMAAAFLMRRRGITNFWLYLLIPGVLCWWSFQRAGLHAALGLVPIIPFMPSEPVDLGLFSEREEKQHDTLNDFEHFFKYPVEVILGLFGLVSAGVVFTISVWPRSWCWADCSSANR